MVELSPPVDHSLAYVAICTSVLRNTPWSHDSRNHGPVSSKGIKMFNNIQPTSYHNYSSDSDNETKREESPSRGQPSSSNAQPSTRIPDRNRRLQFAPPSGPKLERSGGQRWHRPTLGEHLEQMRLNENINLNKVAEKMRALESSFTGLVKEYTDKGELPPKIQKDYKIYSPDDIAKVIEAFNEMAYGGSDTE